MSRYALKHYALPTNPPALGAMDIFSDSANRKLTTLLDNEEVDRIVNDGWRDRNILINGGFDFAQRQVPTTLTSYTLTANRSYGFDRWGMTIQASNLQCQQVQTDASVENGIASRNYGKFKQITAVSKSYISQVVEGNDCMCLRGRTVRFQFKAKYTISGALISAATLPIRFGLLYLTSAGTLDTIPATFVTASASSGYDGLWGTNLALVNPSLVECASVGGGLPTVPVIKGSACTGTLTNQWQRFSAVFTLPTTFKNIIPVIWNDTQMAVNDELNLAEVGLYDGQEIRDWAPMPEQLELMRCQRFYSKTFPLLVAPAQTGGLPGILTWMSGFAGAVAQGQNGAFVYPVTMHGIPAITFYSPSAASAQARDLTAAAETAATTASNISDRSCHISCTGAAGTAVGNQLGVHAVAVAEL